MLFGMVQQRALHCSFCLQCCKIALDSTIPSQTVEQLMKFAPVTSTLSLRHRSPESMSSLALAHSTRSRCLCWTEVEQIVDVSNFPSAQCCQVATLALQNSEKSIEA